MRKILLSPIVLVKRILDSIRKFIRKWPILFMLILAVLFLGVLAFGKYVSVPDEQISLEPVPKEVVIYTFDETPKIVTRAKVESSSILAIYAQANGIVDQILVSEGDVVSAGTKLAKFATNYSGANAPGVQIQVAKVQYRNALDSLETQKSLINIQRGLADKSKENSDEIRKISTNSINGTREIIAMNEDILVKLEDNLQYLIDTNVNNQNDAAILVMERAIAGQSAALLQMNAQLDGSELQQSGKSPEELSKLSQDLVLGQLDLQERSLEMGLELARLQLVGVQIMQSLSSPVTPVSGVVERVFLSVNMPVSPGMPIATIRGEAGNTVMAATIPGELAPFVDDTKMSKFVINGEDTYLHPKYVSTTPTDLTMYSVIYEMSSVVPLARSEYVKVEIPLSQISIDKLLVPIEAIHQTQEETIVYVGNNSITEARPVVLSTILGGFVEISKGLNSFDKVIISRNVVAGDIVKID